MSVHTSPVLGPELLVELDRSSELPLHEQLERSLREQVRRGRLPAGAALPSTRGLASRLGVSRGVVTEAYRQLAAEGYLQMRQGAAVRISRAVQGVVPRTAPRSLLPVFPYHFHPGLPDLDGFPRERWLRSLRAAWRTAPLRSVGYGDPRGVPQLRSALADYLARVRGVEADVESMLVCTGFMQGFSMLCRWLYEQGVQSIAVEDPGWHTHRLIAERAGLQTIPVSVDEDGLRVDELQASGASVVVVTPAHQFPTGRVLSSERRAALIEWAQDGERLIVEDDYDAELAHDRVAVGALQGLAPERVLHIGSASKRLAPAMRLGWMLIPSWLSWQLISTKAIEDGGSEVIGQLALCEFIERGELDRHIRRMRARYRQRRNTLLSALAQRLPQLRPGDAGAGLYELVTLPQGVSEPALLSAAGRRGVGLEGLAQHRFADGGAPGIVLGYGSVAEPAIEHGVSVIAQALEEISTRT
jgi:GntR family transcriptional regulator / MocR family aminotransferase